jgi:two-component sensor histidine kinase
MTHQRRVHPANRNTVNTTATDRQEQAGWRWGRALIFSGPVRPAWRSWSVAAAWLAASVFARVALARWLSAFPFLAFFPALVAVALFCGWPQGLAVLAASALLVYVYFGPPTTFVATVQAHPAAGVAAYLVIGGVVVTAVASVIALLRELEHARSVQETLFRELQHRVANNMQVVAATLQTAKRSLTDPAAREIIDLAGGRIQAIAHLHRRLYDPAAYAGGLGPVLHDILAETLADVPVQTRLTIQAESVPVEKLTAILLLVNEAAQNAAKHVFRQQKGRVFEVSLMPAGNERLRLCIRDDGPGLPTQAEGPGPSSRQLGMSIMQALARQLGGELLVEPGPGLVLSVTFRV